MRFWIFSSAQISRISQIFSLKLLFHSCHPEKDLNNTLRVQMSKDNNININSSYFIFLFLSRLYVFQPVIILSGILALIERRG